MHVWPFTDYTGDCMAIQFLVSASTVNSFTA